MAMHQVALWNCQLSAHSPCNRVTPGLDDGGKLSLPGISAKLHMRACSKTTIPKILIIGDSISTTAPGRTHDEIESLWGHIRRSIVEANRHIRPTFVNFGWGGRTWKDLTAQTVAETLARGALKPQFDYGDGTRTWLECARLQSPDLVFIAFGMNDRQRFATSFARASLKAISRWSKVPDLVFITPMVPHRDTAHENISSIDAQEGRYFVAHWMRTWALYHGIGLLDLNRQYALAVHGIDPRQTHLEGDISIRSADLPFAFPDQCDQDFGVEVEVTAAVLAAGLRLTISRKGTRSWSELWITTQNQFIRTQFVVLMKKSPIERIDTVSNVAPPIQAGILTIFIKDNTASIKLDGQVVYQGLIIRHGGRFIPVLQALDESTPRLNLRVWRGEYIRTTPRLNDNEMWGDPLMSREITAGNGLNHPTSLGAALVYRPLFDAQHWVFSTPDVEPTDREKEADANVVPQLTAEAPDAPPSGSRIDR